MTHCLSDSVDLLISRGHITFKDNVINRSLCLEAASWCRLVHHLPMMKREIPATELVEGELDEFDLAVELVQTICTGKIYSSSGWSWATLRSCCWNLICWCSQHSDLEQNSFAPAAETWSDEAVNTLVSSRTIQLMIWNIPDLRHCCFFIFTSHWSLSGCVIYDFNVMWIWCKDAIKVFFFPTTKRDSYYITSYCIIHSQCGRYM